jgi:hypothetical protein
VQRGPEHLKERNEWPREGFRGIVSIKQQILASIKVCTGLVLISFHI